MKYTETRRHMAFEALNLLLIMAVLTYITRLWPILLLVLVAIFISVMELIYWSCQNVDVIVPELERPRSSAEASQQNSNTNAYQRIHLQITQRLQKDYPNVRWVWENPRVREDIIAGNPVFILLNQTGGYRRAQVILQNLTVVDVLIQHTSSQETEPQPAPAPITEPEAEPIPENYGLMAFQWVDAHIIELNARLNEALGFHLSEILIRADELPVRESWDDIRQELARNELPDTVCCKDGILIKIKQ